MIGGYVFRNVENSIMDRLNSALGKTYTRSQCCEKGIIFHDNPFSDVNTAFYTSENLTILSQDMLVGDNSNGDYSIVDLHKDFSSMFRRKKASVFQDVVSEYRMIIIEKTDEDTELYLVSNRAGNGRIYYCTTESGILFSSDFRFLLKIVPFDVNDVGIYAIIKYGAIPEPLTISKNVKAVPAAHYLHKKIGSNICRTNAYFQFEFPCDKSHKVTDLVKTLQPAKQELRKSAKFLRQYDPAILISGGIDSSLYASYMSEFEGNQLHGINCKFGDDDPEFEFARKLAMKINAQFHVGKMEIGNAMDILNDTVKLTAHPFSDFSSLPIVFILKYLKDHIKNAHMLIEGNGADDCFGFPALTTQSKMQIKHHFPKLCKDLITSLFRNSKSWKWLSNEGILAKVLSLADNHEINLLNNFLVTSPVNFLQLNTDRSWDTELTDTMEGVYVNCTKEHGTLSFEAKTTVRQLLHINSRRWAAKAFSGGEDLGIRVIYPYIWRDVLKLQGSIPWEAKVNKGIVKWPLKQMLEEFMPKEFIYRQKSGFVPPFVQWLTSKDFNSTVREILLQSNGTVTNIVPTKIINELLDDALTGKNLRFPILNFLWGALFTEMWTQNYKSSILA